MVWKDKSVGNEKSTSVNDFVSKMILDNERNEFDKEVVILCKDSLIVSNKDLFMNDLNGIKILIDSLKWN